MTDAEARVAVAHAVTEGLMQKFTEAAPAKMHEAAALMVNTILDEYFRCRLMAPPSERKPS